MTTSLVTTGTVGICCAAVGAILGVLYAVDKSDKNIDAGTQQLITSLQNELERQKALRAQERNGRTNAEREAREIVQRQLEMNGYKFESIGHVESCFPDRRGTPRQGTFFPLSRARIQFRTSIPPASLECVEQFSHLWVLFVFHENTNMTKVSNHKSTYPAKIAPPRLKGQKVGLFSTRTPHRPNSIGLTVVKIEKVDGRCIEISGHDLVNGTPVLDIKPYLHADYIPDFKTPHWVMDDSDAVPRPVQFSCESIISLEQLIHENKLGFYTSLNEIQQAIQQMLVLDIRSVHQGRGHANKEQHFVCHFDALEIVFQTLESHIQILSCQLA